MLRVWVLALAAAMAAAAQKPLDLVLILEPVEWGESPGGRVSRTAEELRLRPDDRLAVIELINGPKVKAKLGEGKTSIGMRWRPTFRFGADAGVPEPRARRVYDALVLATRQLPDEMDAGRQRAVLLVTADEELGSKAKLGDVRAALKAAQARIAVLAEDKAKGEKRLRRGVSLADVVRETGGEWDLLAGRESLNEAIAKLRR